MKKRLIYTIAIVFVVFAPTGLFAQDPNTNTTTESNNLFKETLKKAENGDADAQFNIGVMYAKGQGVQQDFKEAVKWYTKAAEQEHVAALRELGNCYRKGEGVPQDDIESTKCYVIAAAAQGDVFHQYLLAGWYANGDGFQQDYKKAIKWYTKAAEQDHVMAQYNLGVIHDNGERVPINYKEAAKWYAKAAEQGFPPAQFRLGLMYESGCEGLPLDVKKAIDWYIKAAEQGYASAQCNLGIMYFKGEGVVEDYVEAYKWFLLAGINGKDASVQRKYLQSKMNINQITQAQQRAKEFVPKKEWQSVQDANSTAGMKIKGNGTGFFITTDGYLLTAYHVVSDIEAIQVKMGKELNPAKVVRADVANDIALLKVDGIQVEAMSVQSSRDVKVGQEIFTLGFPNIQIQGTEAKYTQGSISSLSGIGDDPRLFQISTAVQPGNSGGPLLDGDGQVVGLVVAKLDEIATAKETGSLPQNVNYALKSSFVLSFLESLPELNGKLLEPKKAGLTRTQVVEKTSKAVVMVLCY